MLETLETRVAIDFLSLELFTWASYCRRSWSGTWTGPWRMRK